MRSGLLIATFNLIRWTGAANLGEQIPIESSTSEGWKGRSQDGPGLDEKTSEYVEQMLEHFHAPGLAVAVLRGNETLLDAFGQAILGQTVVPTTPDTLFYIASLTKSFTGAALLHTLSRESASPPLTLKTKLESLLPADFSLPCPYATSHATVADALSHRLGLPACDVSYGGPGFSVRDAVRLLRHLPQVSELRQDFRYLNLGYMTLQHVIETLTGKWIGDVHREVLWDPLGMTSTVIRLSDALALDERNGRLRGSGRAGENRLAHGYTFDAATNGTTRQPWTDTPLVGGGGIISSARDMAAWLRYFMDGHAPEQLTTPLTLMSDGSNGRYPHMGPQLYAMGWGISSYRGEVLVSHAGGLPGFSTYMAYLPERRWGAVLLSNADTSGEAVVDAVFLRLMDDALGVPPEDRYDPVPSLDQSAISEVQIWHASRDLIFPPESIPDPPVPRSRPLSAYEGTYWDDGFRSIELHAREPKPATPVKDKTQLVLGADLRRWINVTIEFEWVSGEHFVAWLDTEVSSALGRGGVPATFTVGPDGEVETLGLVADPALFGSGERVWFRKEMRGK